MSSKPNNLPSDIRGVSSLAIDAIIGVTDLVESLHQTISSSSGVLDASGQKRTTGITGMVYRNIRAIAALQGNTIDIPLALLSSMLGEQESSPNREAVLSALNGAIGDHLAAKNNPLAISMQLRHNGQPMDEHALAEALGQANGKLLILVHGACMNDLQWTRQGHDHGMALARDLGFLPLYLRYNTGLHISENGRRFADVLEKIMNQLPQPPELFIVAHSMGGLVSRSACYYAKVADAAWLRHLHKLVFLGTPHHGAPLEKGGNWIDIMLSVSPYSAPFSRLGKVRSCGITDLRYGNVVDEDWQGRDRFELAGDRRIPVPLPEAVSCYAIASTTGNSSNPLGDDLIGDGLVTLDSALGRHNNQALHLAFPETQQWIGRNMNHIDLLNHPEVYEVLKSWLEN